MKLFANLSVVNGRMSLKEKYSQNNTDKDVSNMSILIRLLPSG